jgi:hypothetical protein
MYPSKFVVIVVKIVILYPLGEKTPDLMGFPRVVSGTRNNEFIQSERLSKNGKVNSAGN